jgi:hypothetical protein
MNDSSLIAFLRARIDEDGQLLDSIAAQLAGADDEPSTMDGGWNLWGTFGGLVDRALDFGRLRADVAAKRAILDLLVHEGGWELRHGVEGDEIVTYYWSTCSCGWEQEVYRNGDIEDAHERHRESVGYGEAVTADVARLLAAPYASHPDFDPAWLVEP